MGSGISAEKRGVKEAMLTYPKIYSKIVTKQSQRFFTYRTNILAGVLTALFMLGARYALWTALFATGNAGGATLAETMTFFIITDTVIVWLASNYGDILGQDIRSGEIAHRLIRPFPYHLQLLAMFHAGSVSATLTRTLPMLVVALIFIGLLPPVSVTAFGFFVLAAVLGALIYSLIDLIISYTAFWLSHYWYLAWFKRALFTLFGGLALPLWFYPEWLREICELLPFQYAIFMPISIYLGRVSADQIAFVLFMQIFWIAVLLLIERALWRLAQRKLVVQGG